jgi:hypothetical protein
MESHGGVGLTLEYYFTPSYGKAMGYIQDGAKGTNYRRHVKDRESSDFVAPCIFYIIIFVVLNLFSSFLLSFLALRLSTY